VVAINRFDGDKPGDLDKIVTFCEKHGVEAEVATHFRDGGKGAEAVANAVLRTAKKNTAKLTYLYPLSMPLDKKIETVAQMVYGAGSVSFDHATRADLELITRHGYGNLPVCIAKTPLSLSDDPKLRGRPRDFRITVNEIRVSAGAGFVVAICGNIVTMPGLPKVPAAARIKILANGKAVGLT
jgi:formate--tetrahydrofolate ligase